MIIISEILINILIIFLSFVIVSCFLILIAGAVSDWKVLLTRRGGKK